MQDAGAQLAAPLLNVRRGMRVLDACAAPGGKTGHLLELLGEGADLTALDVDAATPVAHRREPAAPATPRALVAGDAADPATLRGERAFERILVDAPCSSTGVIRRHPDIKLLRRPDGPRDLRSSSSSRFCAAWRLLAPGRAAPLFDLLGAARGERAAWSRRSSKRSRRSSRSRRPSRWRPGRSAARSACSFCREQRRGPMASIMLVSKRQRPEPEHAAGGPHRPRSIRA